MPDDLDRGRDRPPKDDEWTGIWSAVEKAEKSWIITGPIYAVVSNWRALVVIAGVIVFINKDAVQAFLALALGGGL